MHNQAHSPEDPLRDGIYTLGFLPVRIATPPRLPELFGGRLQTHLFASVPNEAAVTPICPERSHPRKCRGGAVPDEAMRSLVSPEGTLFVITDTNVDGPDLAALKVRRPDLPPLKNVHQLLGFTQTPNGRAARGRQNWQLLEEVRWAESASSGDLVPLIGTRQHALDQFNRYLRTTYPLDDSFCKMLAGSRPFGEWQRLKLGLIPAEAAHLANGSTLFGLRAHIQRCVLVSVWGAKM